MCVYIKEKMCLCACNEPLASYILHSFVVLNPAGGIIAAPTVNRQETFRAQPAM